MPSGPRITPALMHGCGTRGGTGVTITGGGEVVPVVGGGVGFLVCGGFGVLCVEPFAGAVLSPEGVEFPDPVPPPVGVTAGGVPIGDGFGVIVTVGRGFEPSGAGVEPNVSDSNRAISMNTMKKDTAAMTSRLVRCMMPSYRPLPAGKGAVTQTQ